MSYTIERICEMTGAQRTGDAPAHINWLLTDSRSLSFPEDTLFFALPTRHDTGANYVADLYARGVRNFVLSQADFDRLAATQAVPRPDANYLLTASPLKALQKLAEAHRGQFGIPVIGITGSNGKTVVKEWLHQLLSPDRRIVRSPRSYNSQIGVPLSVWLLDADTDLGIFEAGISQPGEMPALQRIIRPTIGILTGIGGAHQENFSSVQEKCMEKLALFKECDVLIYDADNELLANCVSRAMLPAREIAWSRTDMDRPLYISRIARNGDHTDIAYRYLEMDGSFCLPFVDEASIEDALNCLAACLYLMVPQAEIARRMQQLQPVAMRLEVKEGQNACILINDSYNSDLASLDIALDFMDRRAKADPGLKRTLILSDMMQTGQTPAALYRQVARLAASRGVQRFVGVGPELTAQAERFAGLPERHFFARTEDLDDAIRRGTLRLDHEVALIKGARAFGFDVLAERLEQKTHQTTLEIDLGALAQNLNHYRSLLKPGVKLACMVKASAYGAGAPHVARTLQEHHADYLCVAVADEGADLRRAGITTPIMVMNPEPNAFKTLFDHRLEPEVYSFGLLQHLQDAAQREGIVHLPIHIKIDTGMHRLGFNPADMPLLAERLKRQDALTVRSVFSHLAVADEPQQDAFTRRQIDLFCKAAEQLQEATGHPVMRHICNTAGIERLPGAQFDMVRLGLGLYGIDPVTNRTLHNVCSLKTTILQIRDVAAGDTVGYGRRGLVERPSRIAAIPIGYADGLNRHLGNGNAYCLVNGQKAPYVGNICMDVCMIDVTGIDCHEGDSVEIFGNHLPVSILADAIGTIPYEVLTSISTRVKRVYFVE